MMTTIPPKVCIVLIVVLTRGPGPSWYSASAQHNLPTELQGEYLMSEITMHFCAESGGQGNCMHDEGARNICCTSNNNHCFKDTEPSMCIEDDQNYVCGYRDAIVCQYKDGRGSCIYSNSSSVSIEPLCVCKENGKWPTSANQTSQIRRSCEENYTTIYTGPSTATSSISDQTTTISSMSHQTTTISSVSDQTTATSSVSDQTTATSSVSHQTTDTNAPQKSDSGEVNIVAIVLGTILVIVLLVLLVVCLVKRRRSQTPPKKATTDPTNSSGGSSSAGRAQAPDPLVLGGTEYNYAYDHWPQSNPASDPGKPKPVNRYEENEFSGISSTIAGNSSETIEVPKYYEVGQTNYGRKGGETPQGPKYYAIGQASYAAKSQENLQAPKYDEVRRRPHTEQENNENTPRDPNYFELEQLSDAVNGGKTPQAPKYDEVRRGHHTEQNRNEKTPQSPKYDEVRRRPHTEQSSNEKTPQDSKYFELEHPQDNDTETMVIEVDGSANPSPGGFLNQGYDQAYMPLKQTAKPAESGYEPLKVPPPTERNDDASSPYDHLKNKTGIRSQTVKSPEKEDDDRYASLNI